MAMLMVNVAALVAIAMLVVAAPPLTEAAISCGQVVQSLTPCLGYVQGGGVGPVPAPCCSGIKQLNSAAKTTPDRQAACKCLKSLAGSYPGFAGTAAAMPGKCGVKIPYKISSSIDCSKIK
ncbi:hypothetical protein Drorol1_Dr00014695 [Drosera rotundifolia]